jgi:hypothetical protein
VATHTSLVELLLLGAGAGADGTAPTAIAAAHVRRAQSLNLTMKESDVPDGFKEYRRCVSLPEKEREVINPCQDIFFCIFLCRNGSSFTYMI